MRGRVAHAEERMDTMREMLLVLEHTQENPIVVDDEESEGNTAVSDGVDGEELEVEENEVVIPIPIHWGQRGCYPGGKLRV